MQMLLFHRYTSTFVMQIVRISFGLIIAIVTNNLSLISR